MTLLTAEHLSVSYRGKPVVRDFSISAEEKECLSLMGPSGAGKTTVLRALAGLVKPQEGKVFLEDKDITEEPPSRREMAMVFQNMALFPHTKIKDNITYGLSALGWSKETIQTELLRMAERLKIADQLDKYPNACSGGQKQRAGIARALIRRPRILLLDEPFSSLDQNLREELLKELQQLQKETAMTMIYVTHDRREAEVIADRIALLKDGKLVTAKSPKQLYEDPETLETAILLGSAFELLPVTAKNRILYADGKALPGTADVPDGAYTVAFRAAPVTSHVPEMNGPYYLFETESGKRIR